MITYENFINQVAKSPESARELASTVRVSKSWNWSKDPAIDMKKMATGFETELRVKDWLTVNNVPFKMPHAQYVYQVGDPYVDTNHPDFQAWCDDGQWHTFEIKHCGSRLYDVHGVLYKLNDLSPYCTNKDHGADYLVVVYEDTGYIVDSKSKQIRRVLKLDKPSKIK